MWDAIVVLDSDLIPTEFVAKNSRRHLYLRFDDVSADKKGKRCPTLDDLQNALRFAELSKRLLVCCRAGQSRSAGLAFAIACKFCSPIDAIALLNPKRHNPNLLLVKLANELLDNPNVLLTLEEWRSRNKNIRPSEFVDDLDKDFRELERLGARNLIVSPEKGEKG